MANVKKACRVCGKDYEPCRSAKIAPGVFHWQEVACSPECGAEYLRLVMEARNSAKEETAHYLVSVFTTSEPEQIADEKEAAPVADPFLCEADIYKEDIEE